MLLTQFQNLSLSLSLSLLLTVADLRGIVESMSAELLKIVIVKVD